jgi:Protein of unknown function (DUF3263)
MLTHDDVRLLEFEEAHPRFTDLKADAIVHRLGMSPSRYYQRLSHLAKQRDAMERYPGVCSRVNRREERRREQHDRTRRLAS